MNVCFNRFNKLSIQEFQKPYSPGFIMADGAPGMIYEQKSRAYKPT